MRLGLALLWLVAGCANAPRPVRVTSFHKPPDVRLPTGPRPLRYALDLTPDAERGFVYGVETIDIELPQPTRIVWLHARGLRVEKATWRIGDRVVPIVPLRVVPAVELLGLSSETLVGPGKVQLQIEFRAWSEAKSAEGVLRRNIDGHWYTFTQFEPNWARRAFPCFDEPGFKARWQLTLHVFRNETAVSNTPIVSEVDEPGNTKRVVFAETPPLPSYLISFAVGPFDVVDAGPSGEHNTPVRVLVPHGQRATANAVATVTPKLLPLFESYTGIPYPFDKLDIVSIPNYRGAMEHPGLITFDQRVLAGSDDRTRNTYVAHELAHQWFGNYVTLAWWNDVWLNESLATWFAAKILDRHSPGGGRVYLSEAAHVMAYDDYTSRALDAPIVSEGAIVESFKGPLYQKGAAIMAMIESWIGEEPLQRGLRAYLHEHAWKNVVSADLIAALQHETALPVGHVLESFLSQPGAPLLSVALTCEPAHSPTVQVAAEPYREIRSPPADHRRWSVPVCVSWIAGEARGSDCELLDGGARSIALHAPSCPSLVLLGKDGARYYRPLYSAQILDGQRRSWREVSPTDRLYFLSDLRALIDAGRVAPSLVLPFLPLLLEDADEIRIALTAALARNIGRELIPPSTRRGWTRFIRETFAARSSEEVPWTGSDWLSLRDELLANEGADPRAIAEAQRRFTAWLSGTNQPALDEHLARAAARTGDQALFTTVLGKLVHSKNRPYRRLLLGALGSFRDADLEVQSLDLLSSRDLQSEEAYHLLLAMVEGARMRDELRAFLQDNAKPLTARLPPQCYRWMMDSLRIYGELREADEPKLREFLRPYAR